MIRSIIGLGAAGLLATAPVEATAAPASDVSISDAWTRPTAIGASEAVGYLTVRNAGGGADRLIGGASSAAKAIEIHQSTTVGGVMRMREIPDGVPIPPHSSVAFAPNGYHLMLVAPKRRFRPGDRIPVVLRFAHAGAITTPFVVRRGPSMAPMKMR